MKPYIKEFQNEDTLQQSVRTIKRNGVHAEDLYVLTHDDERTERISDKAHTNIIGAEETGIGNVVGNFFSKKGDELRNQLTEIGFTDKEAESYEKKLDEGKVLLIVTNPENYQLV